MGAKDVQGDLEDHWILKMLMKMTGYFEANRFLIVDCKTDNASYNAQHAIIHFTPINTYT